MDYKISKELFEEVMGFKIFMFDIKGRKNSKVIVYSFGYLGSKSISINDFFFKCKDWILSKRYSNLSGKDNIYDINNKYVCSVGNSKILIEDFYAESEEQSVFDACQWIYDKEIKGKK